MSFIKYRVREVAADFGMTPKEVTEVIGKYFDKPKSNSQVLTDEQLNAVFDHITQNHQIGSLEQGLCRRQTAGGQAGERDPQSRCPGQGQPRSCQDPSAGCRCRT